MKWITAIVIIVSLVGCQSSEKKMNGIPGVPLLYFNFDSNAINKGISPVNVLGNSYPYYSKGILGKCFDLSDAASQREPFIIPDNEYLQWGDYEGFSIQLWVQAMQEDNNPYLILGNKTLSADTADVGWAISKNSVGSWVWEISDGVNQFRHEAPVKHQNFNDGDWHHIGVSCNFDKSEIRIYFDGKNVGVFTLNDLKPFKQAGDLFIGSEPNFEHLSENAFNGKIDEVGIWSRVLTDVEFQNSYTHVSKKVFEKDVSGVEQLKVLTWNVNKGGKSQGVHVGLERIATIIKASNADVVCLQECDGNASKIASLIGFYLAQRGTDLAVLSRFPIVETYKPYKDDAIYCVRMNYGESREVCVCPIELNSKSNVLSYVLNGGTNADTIVSRENQFRAKELLFMMSELNQLIAHEKNISIVVAGSFYSGSHLDWTTQTSSKHNDLVINFPTTNYMSKHGFNDAFRDVYKDEVTHPGYTLLKHPRLMRDRQDFIFYKSDQFKAQKAQVIDTLSVGFPSDHGALLSVFTFDKNE